MMWSMLWGLIALALFFLRPRSLRNNGPDPTDPAQKRPPGPPGANVSNIYLLLLQRNITASPSPTSKRTHPVIFETNYRIQFLRTTAIPSLLLPVLTEDMAMTVHPPPTVFSLFPHSSSPFPRLWSITSTSDTNQIRYHHTVDIDFTPCI